MKKSERVVWLSEIPDVQTRAHGVSAKQKTRPEEFHADAPGPPPSWVDPVNCFRRNLQYIYCFLNVMRSERSLLVTKTIIFSTEKVQGCGGALS